MLVRVEVLWALSLHRSQPSYLFISVLWFACKFFHPPYYYIYLYLSTEIIPQNCVLRLFCRQYLERTKFPLLIPSSILREWNNLWSTCDFGLEFPTWSYHAWCRSMLLFFCLFLYLDKFIDKSRRDCHGSLALRYSPILAQIWLLVLRLCTFCYGMERILLKILGNTESVFFLFSGGHYRDGWLIGVIF